MQQTRRRFIEMSGGAIAIGSLAGCTEGDDDDHDDDHDDHDDHDDDHDDHDDHDDDHDDHDDHDDDHDDHDHDDEGWSFELLDRDTDEVIAYVHGDHWDDGPFEVPVGDHVSVGADVEDDHGDHVHFEDGLELRAEHADGARELLEFDHHGDHLYVEGVEAGITEVVFMVWHDDHADYTTPPLTVEVVDD